MNYGYAGTRELNEALVSRFTVIRMPTLEEAQLCELLRANAPRRPFCPLRAVFQEFFHNARGLCRPSRA